MQFEVVETTIDCKNNNTIYLMLEKWNDWYTYSTLFKVIYIDKDGKDYELGRVKIGQDKQGAIPQLPKRFEQLEQNFFSLGASEIYYEKIKKNFSNEEQREEIYIALNDIAYNLELFERVKGKDVVQISLMRDYSESIVRNQFHRMTLGGAWLTPYTFSFFPYGAEDLFDIDKTVLNFEVKNGEMPPSNIHVLIGKNGVGKTTLLKNMVKSLENKNENVGEFVVRDGKGFSNVIYVSFSAFDSFIEIEDDILKYSYIGLAKKDGMKNIDELAQDFAASLFEINSGNRKKLWDQTIDILESDNTFVELEIKKWHERYEDRELLEIEQINAEDRGFLAKNFLKTRFEKKIIPHFKELSSGHKVILLIVAKLIELVEEKTLVIMDEPEEHLHPPLVSALIRALSNLLTYRNGVGIIATHSPVIVQEVPRKCVWILRREGELIAERPSLETFGENLGILTSEIFGYEVTNSGFHALIKQSVDKHSSYKSALSYFKGHLGDEGKMILRSLIYEKENSEDNIDD